VGGEKAGERRGGLVSIGKVGRHRRRLF
jgi:hypothetical protein